MDYEHGIFKERGNYWLLSNLRQYQVLMVQAHRHRLQWTRQPEILTLEALL